MSEPAPADTGLLASLRRLIGTALEIARVRLDLLAVELEQEKLRIFDGLLWAALALLLLGVGITLAVGLLLMLLWDGYRLAALAMLSLLFMVAGAFAVRVARRHLRSGEGLVSGSLAELANDRDALRGPR